MRHDRDPILYRVFKAYGNATALARILGVSKQSIAAWKKVPVKYIMQISQEKGISPHELRPDIYAQSQNAVTDQPD